MKRFGSRIAVTLKVVESINAEMKPNGGRSMRDVLDWQTESLKNIDMRLAVQECRHRALMHCLDIACWESDTEGKCTAINAKLAYMTGMTFEDARGMGWVNYVAEEDRPRVLKEWNHAIEQGREFVMSFTVVNIRTKQKVRVVAHAYVVWRLDGSTHGHIGTISPALPEKPTFANAQAFGTA